jgi:hypothetical protein
VTVHVHWALRSAASERDVELSLPEGATAGDLLARLAERFGPHFGGAVSGDARIPREVRMFVGGDIVASREERLAAPGGLAPVTVVLVSPIAGG